jgi:hypothetical protein
VTARQFGKLYWDIDASPEARIIVSYVEYRCHSKAGPKPCEIVEADFIKALRRSRTTTRSAICEAIGAGLIARTTTKRGDGRGVYVYTVLIPDPTGIESIPDGSSSKTGPVLDPNVSGVESVPDPYQIQTGQVQDQDISDPTVEPIEPKKEPGEEPVEPERIPRVDQRQAEHHRIVTQQAANAAEIQRATTAKLQHQGGVEPGTSAKPHWLTEATRELGYFATVGDQNERWRTKAEETMQHLGWTRDDVLLILRGCQREHDELRQSEKLASAIDRGEFPRPTHVFSRGFQEQWIHRVDKIPWSEWAYKRWAAPAKQAAEAKPERWKDRVARENRERLEDNARRRGAVAP